MISVWEGKNGNWQEEGENLKLDWTEICGGVSQCAPTRSNDNLEGKICEI